MITQDNKTIQLIADTLSQTTPVLSDEILHPFIQKYIDKKDWFLDVVRRHGSPLYLLDTQNLRQRASRFQSVFADTLACPVRIYYAVKSNNHPTVTNIFIDCGLGLDVSSGEELKLAAELGAKDIIFSGPGKTDTELTMAVAHADCVTVLIDSFSELGRLAAIAAHHRTHVRAGVRLTVNPQGMWRKFGIRLERLEEFVAIAHSCSHIRMIGLQFHSSWNLSPQSQVQFIEQLTRILEQLPEEYLSAIEFLDIGGGYWPELGEWLQEAGTAAGSIRRIIDPSVNGHQGYCLPAMPIEQFAQQISKSVSNHLLPLIPDLTICLEPGRWLCHEGMHLLMTVIDCKESDLVITDAGGNAIGWERFETDYFPVINLTRPALEQQPCEVHGCLCTPHDIWGYHYFGRNIKPGDILMIPTQGAYTYSLRQQFIKPIPTIAVASRSLSQNVELG